MLKKRAMEKILKVPIFVTAGLIIFLICVCGAFITVKMSLQTESENNNQTEIDSELENNTELPMVVAFSPFAVADAPKVCNKGYKLDNSGRICRKSL